MERIPGAHVALKGLDIGESDARLLTPQDDGYLGRLSGETILLTVSVAPGLPLYGFSVDGNKNISPRRNLIPREQEAELGKRYRQAVSVKHGGDCSHTDANSNHIRLLEAGPDGRTIVWEIAVIAQHGDFFLTIEQRYSFVCYQNREEIVCPRFYEQWEQFISFMGQVLEIERLPSIADYDAHPQPAPRIGEVLWFSSISGVGAVQAREGDNGVAKVYWANIVSGRPRRRYLVPGEIVDWKEISEIPNHQSEKKRHTTFKLEVFGVTPRKS